MTTSLFPIALLFSIFLTIPCKAFADVQISVNPRFSVTSSHACVRASECHPSFFCDGDVLPRCRRRVSKGKKCSGRPRECQEGLQCQRQHYLSSRKGRCQPLRQKGQSCDSSFSCRPGLFCSPGHVCLKIRSLHGRCQTTPGCEYPLRCANGRCRKRKYDGQPCTPGYKFSECKGYCASPSDHPSTKPVCQPGREINQHCTKNIQCIGWGSDRGQRTPVDRVLCNGIEGFERGVCTKESALLTKLGAHCHPNTDLCDARRDLRCRLSPALGRHVCQHRVGRVAGLPMGRFCEPRSMLSLCRREGVRNECRRERSMQTGKAFGLYRCLAKKVYLQSGKICGEKENRVCGKGLVCLRISEQYGVKYSYSGKAHGLGYCVRVVGKGKDCGNRSHTRCEYGLSCEKGVCKAW